MDTITKNASDDTIDQFLDEKFKTLCNIYMTNEVKKYLVKQIISRILMTQKGDCANIPFIFKYGNISASEENCGFISKIVQYIIKSENLDNYIKVNSTRVVLATSGAFSFCDQYICTIDFKVLDVPEVFSYIAKYDTTTSN
jgi:hypothetical protein